MFCITLWINKYIHIKRYFIEFYFDWSVDIKRIFMLLWRNYLLCNTTFFNVKYTVLRGLVFRAINKWKVQINQNYIQFKKKIITSAVEFIIRWKYWRIVWHDLSDLVGLLKNKQYNYFPRIFFLSGLIEWKPAFVFNNGVYHIRWHNNYLHWIL